ncbi:hypothetical protein FVB9288_02700 [Flavobacterium sp. CECT 9288]|uniref:T9SS type A sorting domain-containing protein n=1 Tax=Flavobacterium sp. CECT 9288 TaxID=2845819 RepID=UPI001E3C7CA1|nr:T9SS type A sorting domain-containing protein [Flavobacterium sp. CECT 9288]CAH0336965.1 hypothetical protein FVB9288_02700 [Flavobacterium sp. CECT 9288]
MKKIYLFNLLTTLFYNNLIAQKIQISKEQLTPLTHFEINADYGKLVDGVVGLDNQFTYAPANNTSAISWPHKVLIDLRGTYNITQLRAHDGFSSPTINWYAGTSAANTNLIAGPISLTGFNSYNTQNVTANGVRYIIIEQLENLSRFPSEIEIYGTAISTIPSVTATTKPPIDAKQLLGSNGYITNDPIYAGLFTGYRCFSEVDMFFDPNAKLMVSPSNTGGIHFKNNMTALKNVGTESIIVLQESPLFFMNKSAAEHDRQYKPIAWNITNYNIPSNWQEIAKVYYRLAGYIGSQKIPLSDMNFNTTPQYTNQTVNIAESGLGLANWIEVLNEPDKTWAIPQTAGYYSPFTLASLMSAAYDGHQGTISKAGIKTADPNLKVAMGGIYKLQYEYIKAMHEWAKANRTDGKFPADAINFHHYNSNSANGDQGGGTGALHPEQGQLITQMQQVIDYRNKYLPNVEIWLSEWGMSTNNGPLQVPNLASYGNKEDVQGAWMIRTYLALMKLNIDKSYMYQTIDENDPNNNSTFGGVGILKHGTLEKKRSYYYVSDFTSLFKNKNYKLKSDLSTTNVRDYVFEDITEGKEMRFVWSPTGNETTIPNYNVTIAGTNITGYQFTGQAHGISNYPNSNTITVTEIPRVFIYNTNTLSIDEIEKENLVTYPNPTFGKIHINKPVKSISILNITGQTLETIDMSNKNTSIDLKNHSAGVYILKITTEENKIKYTKIIKK